MIRGFQPCSRRYEPYDFTSGQRLRKTGRRSRGDGSARIANGGLRCAGAPDGGRIPHCLESADLARASESATVIILRVIPEPEPADLAPSRFGIDAAERGSHPQ